jgi:carboxyl-terminal processing protease
MKRRIFITLSAVLIISAAAKTADDYFEISKNLEIFSSVYKEVNTHYVDELKPGELMRTGVDAMLSSLDPYTNFYSEAQAEDALIQHRGEYGGIGCNVIKIGKDKFVNEVFKGFPAAMADMRVGDRFLSVNGKDVSGENSERLSDQLQGGVGKKLIIKLYRPSHGEITKEVYRNKIEVKNVPYWGMIDHNTGYIKLDRFMAEAAAEIHGAMVQLKKNPNFKSLVLDLRDNGGGYLHEAVNIVNLFVPANQLVVTTKGRRSEMFKEYKTRIAPLDKEIPLIVLINGRSASASEIVSGSIQDLDRGVIVGTNSFGKGLVQNTKPTLYRTQVKITTAKYYTPSGRCIQLKDYGHRNEDGSAGIIPDSLRTSFKTSNGRTVKDGGGVQPDAVVEKPNMSSLLEQLIKGKQVFHFCNKYRNQNDSIVSAKEFRLNDQEFESFIQHVDTSGFQFKSKASDKLKELKKIAEDESLNGQITVNIKNIETQLKAENRTLLMNHKDEIVEELEKEIARRYYYEDALIEASFDKDPDILKSLELFSRPIEIQNILNRI